MPHNFSFGKSVITSGNDTLVDLMNPLVRGPKNVVLHSTIVLTNKNPSDVPRQRSTQIEPTNLLLEDAWGSKKKSREILRGPRAAINRAITL